MVNQRALQVSCADGRHDLASLESSSFIGCVDYSWANRNQDDPTFFGIGPLAGTTVPGADNLVIAARSPLWDGYYSTAMPGGGLLLSGLGCHLIALSGRAARPSALVITRRGGKLESRLLPLDPEPLWKGTHDGEGVYALIQHLVNQLQDTVENLQVLATGPAAAITRFGAICSATILDGQPRPVHGWIGRGGFGSRLLQLHNLCAVVLGSDELADRVQVEPFNQKMSLPELEQAVRYKYNPRILSLGSLGATLSARNQRMLCFNSTSIFHTAEQRNDLYQRVLRDHYLSRLIEGEGTETHQTCGEPCPLTCKTLVGGRLKEVEPYLALGPQIGVLDPAAADLIVTHCKSLGFDSLTLGSIIAWLMERIDRKLVEPGYLGIQSRPRWSAAGFAPEEDSHHNARLARDLAEGILFAPWGQPLRNGLRSAARSAGEPAEPLAVYIANGDYGEMAPAAFWATGFYTPMPITGEHMQYYGAEFTPPRRLGRKSAHRMVEELMLQNLGICRLHRGWAEEMIPDLVNQHLGTSTDWTTHHRDLAKRIFRRRKARFWETGRVIDIIATFLQDYQFEAAPDRELDRWVRRFREDRPGAARAFWSEINAGLEEILG